MALPYYDHTSKLCANRIFTGNEGEIKIIYSSLQSPFAHPVTSSRKTEGRKEEYIPERKKKLNQLKAAT